MELHQARPLKLHCTFRLEDVGGMAARYSGERRTAANFPLLDCYQHILILDRLFVLATEIAVVSSNAPICGLVCGKLPGIVNIAVHCRFTVRPDGQVHRYISPRVHLGILTNPPLHLTLRRQSDGSWKT